MDRADVVVNSAEQGDKQIQKKGKKKDRQLENTAATRKKTWMTKAQS